MAAAAALERLIQKELPKQVRTHVKHWQRGVQETGSLTPWGVCPGVRATPPTGEFIPEQLRDRSRRDPTLAAFHAQLTAALIAAGTDLVSPTNAETGEPVWRGNDVAAVRAERMIGEELRRVVIEMHLF